MLRHPVAMHGAANAAPSAGVNWPTLVHVYVAANCLFLNLAGFHRAYRNERTLPVQIHCVVTQDAEVSTLPRIEVLLQLDTVGLATVISLRSYNIFEQLMHKLYLFPLDMCRAMHE